MNKLIEELAEKANIFTAERDGMGGIPYGGNRKEVEEFANFIIEACVEAVIECDKSPKMILHEPYRSIVSAIYERFED